QDGDEGDDWGCPKRPNRETEIVHRSPLLRADYPLDALRERTVGPTGITSASRLACITRKTGRVVQPDGDGCRMLPRFWRPDRTCQLIDGPANPRCGMVRN